MNYIEKVRARATAREMLGVGKSADSSEIRAAWRRAAFKVHPDQNGGKGEGFARMRAAYELLAADEASDAHWIAFTAATAPQPQAVEAAALRKPRVVTRILPLPSEVAADCRALFGPGAVAADATPSRNDPADHLPTAVAVHGRSLSYHINTPLVRGVNRLALPTAILHGKTMGTPKLVAFRSPTAGGGEIIVPDNVRERFFPGARSVQFRFRAS